METLKELYRIGPGPSSSHTLAPQNACKLFMERFPDVLSFDAELFGSLALTGEGHSTDKIIIDTFAPRQCRITFNAFKKEKFPNGVVLRGFDAYNNVIANWTVYSVGGGAIEIEEEPDLHKYDEVYPHNNMDEVLNYCHKNRISLGDYSFIFENDIEKYLNEVLSQMLKTVSNGLVSSGLLPGKLQIEKVAKALYLDSQTTEDKREKQRLALTAYTYAACEENASGHVCVTAPTMGASGVIAALMYYFYHDVGIPRSKLVRALALGGVFGNVVKKNATLSGAVGGCQAEVGTACAMGSAIVSYLNGDKNDIIAYAAEIGMEHNLGLTCDPVGGYVIIPCIERNAVAALRCLDNAFLAHSVGKHKANKVSFDMVVRTMNYTGKQLPIELKETSLGGLASEVVINETNTLSRSARKEQLNKQEIVYNFEDTSDTKINTIDELENDSSTVIETKENIINDEVKETSFIDEINNEDFSKIVEETNNYKPHFADIEIQDIQLEKTGEFKLSDLDLDLVLSKRKL